MNSSVISKLMDKSGESIAETLVAVLIAAFALLMLAGTVNTSTNLVTKSIQIESEYYNKNNAIEKRKAESEGGYLKVSIDDTIEYELPIIIYKNNSFDSKKVYVYDKWQNGT